MALNNTNRLAGTASFTCNGVTFLLQGDLSWSSASVERESLSGMDSVHGFSEKPKPPFIEGTLRDTNGLKVSDFNAMGDANIVLSLANGKTISGSKMWCTSALEVKSTDATFSVRFEGQQGCIMELMS
jgi:hypothetical protein